MAFLQVAPSHGLVQTCGNQLPREQKHKMADAMADPVATRPRIRRSPGRVALKFVSRLIRPTIVTGMLAALIAPADTPTVLPLTCRITVTRVGGAWIYEPDCSHQSPPSPPSPNGPPSGPGTPPGAPSTPQVVAVDSSSLRGCQHGTVLALQIPREPAGKPAEVTIPSWLACRAGHIRRWNGRRRVMPVPTRRRRSR